MLNTEVTQANIDQTICKQGWAKEHRPLYAFTWSVKRMWSSHPEWYELDHIIPIELGGNAYNLTNLQLQRWKDAFAKDDQENKLHDLVCQHKMLLKDAQEYFYRVWGEGGDVHKARQ